jgi:hypothetical protein
MVCVSRKLTRVVAEDISTNRLRVVAEAKRAISTHPHWTDIWARRAQIVVDGRGCDATTGAVASPTPFITAPFSYATIARE